MRSKLDQFSLADRHSTIENEKYLFFYANIDDASQNIMNLFVCLVLTNFEWNGSVVWLRAEQPTDWRAYVRALRHTGRIPNVFLFHFLFSSVRAS